MSNYDADCTQAADWARSQLAKPGLLILDTETTGLHGDAEIVQIAIISASGQVLLDALVRPTRPIPRDAERIHHISNEQVADAPTFADLAPQLRELLAGEDVVIYNAAYDTRLMEQSAAACGMAYELPIFGGEYHCAMEMYAQWVGDWSDYWGNYRYQRLPGGDHSALGDARACLAVLQRMAALKGERD